MNAHSKIGFLQFGNSGELAEEAGRRFVAAAPKDREFLVALSGGRISQSFYDAIAQEARLQNKKFSHVHFFFADERCVPPDDPESNFIAARRRLFEPLEIRAEQIHRIHGETEDDYAVKEAEAELCRIAPLDPTGQPILDLVILGMGEDGHTASLFPGEPDCCLNDTFVYRAVTTVKPPPRRITLGYTPLAAARQLWVLASGQGKEQALRRVLSEKPARLPLGRVLQSNPKALIFSDIPGSENFPKSF
jgi:6-phosphogluconolactonase